MQPAVSDAIPRIEGFSRKQYRKYLDHARGVMLEICRRTNLEGGCLVIGHEPFALCRGNRIIFSSRIYSSEGAFLGTFLLGGIEFSAE